MMVSVTDVGDTSRPPISIDIVRPLQRGSVRGIYQMMGGSAHYWPGVRPLTPE